MVFLKLKYVEGIRLGEEENNDCSKPFCLCCIAIQRKYDDFFGSRYVLALLLKNTLALRAQRLRESILCDFEDEEFQ